MRKCKLRPSLGVLCVVVGFLLALSIQLMFI